MKPIFLKRFKSIAILSILLTGTLSAHAIEFEKDGFSFTTIQDNPGQVMVSGSKLTGEVVIPSLVDYNNSQYTVTVLGGIDGNGMTSLSLPATIEIIEGLQSDYTSSSEIEVIPGSSTFFGYHRESNFTSINVDSQNPYFSTFDGVLYNKDYTKIIRVPNGKKSINFNPALKEIGEFAFYTSTSQQIDIPSGVTNIGKSAFFESEITTVKLPETLKTISESAFWCSYFLNDIDIPQSLEEIGGGAFTGCCSLTSISIPANTKITDNYGSLYDIFQSCPQLSSLSLPADVFDNFYSEKRSIKSIISILFMGEYNINLTNVNINGESSKFCSIGGVIFDKDLKELHYFPPCKTEISWPVTVETLKANAFYTIRNLTNIELPVGVKKIEADNFVEFPYNQQVSLTIPNTVTDILSYSINVNELYLLPLTPPNAPKLEGPGSVNAIYVYPSVLDTYKNNNNWKIFADKFKVLTDFTNKGKLTSNNAQINKGKTIELPIDFQLYETSPITYSGFQFDVELPEGLSVTNVKLSDELTAAGFEGDNSSTEGNPVRVVSYKTTGNGVSITKGIVTLTIKADLIATEGEKTIKFSNAKLSSTGATSLPLDDSSVTLMVKGVPVTNINIECSSGKDGNLYVGDTAVYSAIVTPSDATDSSVTWSIEDSNVASITVNDSKVNIKALKIGETTLKATANDGSGVVGTATIKVIATPISGVTISSQDNKTSIYPDETLALTAIVNPTTATTPISYAWKSDNPSVATVSGSTPTVNLTAIKPGTTNVTVTATNEAGSVTSMKFYVQVDVREITSVKLSENGPLALDLYKNKEKTITATVNPSNATDPTITWNSDKPEIATVDNGKITAVSLGTAIISVTASNDAGQQTTTITVNVNATPAENIVINGDKHILKVSEELQLKATVTPLETTYPEVEWSSSDDSKATVDATGKVTAKAAGIVTLFAKVKASPDIIAIYNITISDLIMGDANDDGKVDVADVVTIVNEYLQLPNDKKPVLLAYDFNNNGEADENDWKRTLDIILDEVGTRSYSSTSYQELTSNDNVVIKEMSGFGSFRKNIQLELNHSNDYVTMIAEVILPEGAKVESVTKGDKIANHSLAYNVVEGNRLKVAIYSMKNEIFQNNKSLLTIELSNISENEHVELENIYATVAASQRYSLGSEKEYAGINGIIADSEGVYHVFTIQGINVMITSHISELNNLEPGIYIINGKKVMLNK